MSTVGSTSLMHGCFPVVVKLITAAALLNAIGWRSRRWRRAWLPLAIAVGAASGGVVFCYYRTLGLASEPPPWQMWLWVLLSGVAMAVAIFGWRSTGWWRRNTAVFAASFCLLSTGLTINGWLGYFPTVHAAWSQLTDGPLPDQTDVTAIEIMRRKAVVPQRGMVVAVDTGSAVSGFRHRDEWVYLPPAWFGGIRPPLLPAVLMIGGEFNTPVDWIRVGDAVAALDAFATVHGGNAPIAVFPDATGGFTNDTECVNGVRGNAADHLIDEVIPTVDAKFAGGSSTFWGVAGFSSGGTCAVDLAVMHPDMFSAFVDIGGDFGPNAGTVQQSIERLFGGDRNAWLSFDPKTVMIRHGEYPNLSGIFAVPGNRSRAVGQAAAESLCAVGKAHGIACTITALPGKHDWPSAAAAFAASLPWLAGQLHTPGVNADVLPCSRSACQVQ